MHAIYLVNNYTTSLGGNNKQFSFGKKRGGKKLVLKSKKNKCFFNKKKMTKISQASPRRANLF